jgi:hypothetical protein
MELTLTFFFFFENKLTVTSLPCAQENGSGKWTLFWQGLQHFGSGECTMKPSTQLIIEINEVSATPSV